MPSNELKQRKKNISQKQNDDPSYGAKQNGEAEVRKTDAPELKTSTQTKTSLCFPDLRTLLCILCVSVCVTLTWVVLQQNERFAEVEEKYRRLYGRTATYADLEQRVEKVSEKLDASKNRLEGALSSISTAARLASDVASLQSVVTAMQASGEDDVNGSSSGGIQEINSRFLNVTEAWQLGLAAVTTDLKTLREESRASHGRVTESVNDADRRLRALAERLEEFEDSTRRNARAFERTEADDVRQTQGQQDWNTARVSELDEKLARLARTDRELAERLDEQVPRAQQCQEHLPAVEEAVRSILRLATGFASMERRVEEMGLQVLGLEDSMLRGLTQTLQIRQALDALKAGGGGGQRHEEHRSAGTEIDAMLETLREMDMEMERQEAGDHVEEEEGEDRVGEVEVESKGVMEVEKEMERVEEREKVDEGTVTDSIPPEDLENKLGDVMDNPEPLAAELPESSITEETQATGREEEIPESQYSDVNV